jgi:hypothetical protein
MTPVRRAQLTPDAARRTYGDFFDRVIADRGDEPEDAARAAIEAEAEIEDAPAAAPTRQASTAVTQRPARPRPAAKSRHPEPEPPPTDSPRIKATFYLYPEDIVTIDQIQTNEFLRTGKKPQRSEIVSRALRLIGEQQRQAREIPGGIP